MGPPSWRPVFYNLDANYSATSKQHINIAGRGAFTASKGTRATAKFSRAPCRFYDTLLSIHRATLEVKACCIDRIRFNLFELYPTTLFPALMNRKLRRKYASTVSPWRLDREESKLVEHIRMVYNYVMDLFDEGLPPILPGISREDRVEELWRTLIFDRTTEGLLAPPEWSSLFSVIINGPSHVPSDFIPIPANTQYPEDQRAQAYIKPYLDAVQRLMIGEHWVYMTEKGRLGVAEHFDLSNVVGRRSGLHYVYVIPGCNMPILVEPVRKQTREGFIQATTHGSVYLHGYMYGKAIDELESGDLSLVTLALQ